MERKVSIGGPKAAIIEAVGNLQRDLTSHGMGELHVLANDPNEPLLKLTVTVEDDFTSIVVDYG